MTAFGHEIPRPKRVAQVACVSLAVLLCCVFLPVRVQAQNDGLRHVTLQLKWTHQFQFAGFYAAKAKGYYREAGLDVTFKERTQGVDVLEEVISGRADFGIGDANLVMDYFNGNDIVALGAIFQHSPHILLSRASSGITSPRDLRGKRVMILGTTAVAQWAMLASQGIRKEDMELQRLTWSTDELINGETDAMVAYLTTEPYILKKAGVPINILRPLTYGIDFYGDTLFSTSAMAGKDPEMVEAFLKASYRGWAYAMNNHDEIINIIRFKYNSDKRVGELRYEADAMHELILPKLVEVGTMSRKRWEHIAATFRALELTDKSRPLDDFLYIPLAQRKIRALAHWAPYIAAFLLAGGVVTVILLIRNVRLKRNVRLQNREVEHTRENLRQVIDLVPSLIYIKNRPGQFLLLNHAMAMSLGATVEELVGKVHLDVHPDTEQALRMQEADLAVIEGGVPKVSMEEPYLHADGTIHWLQSTRLPFTMADSDEPAVLALSVDITHRREAERAIKENEERFRAIFNQTYQFSSILNLDGDLVQINQSALTVFRKTEEEVLNKPFREADWWSQDRDTQYWLANAVRRAARGETVQTYAQNILPDGSPIDVDFTLKPARNDEGRIIFLIAEGRDITQLKESEEELRRLNEELEQRVASRTRNLEEAKAELEASLEQLHKTQEELILSEKLAALGGLVAGVAHEINTPLGVGVTAGSFLEDKLQQLDADFRNGELKKSDLERFIKTGRESCSTILTNLTRAAELIKSFKQVAADQSSEIPRRFNLRQYIDEVLLSLRPKFKRTDHVIENHCPDIALYSYPGAFMQIVTNLLLNALTHAYGEDEYGHIRIGGRVQGDRLTFTFDDDGHGIAPEIRGKIFEPFYTTMRGNGGTGLGLHIVFNTVTRTLGGTIHVESEVDGGTHFSITMPLKQEGE